MTCKQVRSSQAATPQQSALMAAPNDVQALVVERLQDSPRALIAWLGVNTHLRHRIDATQPLRAALHTLRPRRCPPLPSEQTALRRLLVKELQSADQLATRVQAAGGALHVPVGEAERTWGIFANGAASVFVVRGSGDALINLVTGAESGLEPAVESKQFCGERLLRRLANGLRITNFSTEVPVSINIVDQVPTLHRKYVMQLNGDFVAAQLSDERTRIWDLRQTPPRARDLPPLRDSYILAVSQDGTQLVRGPRSAPELWNLEEAAPSRTLLQGVPSEQRSCEPVANPGDMPVVDTFEIASGRQWAFVNAENAFPANKPETVGDGLDGLRRTNISFRA